MKRIRTATQALFCAALVARAYELAWVGHWGEFALAAAGAVLFTPVRAR